MVNTFVFMGLPGAGKGKQSELLHEKTGFFIHSTGEELRKLVKGGGQIGKRIEEVMLAGGNMPPWLASYLFQKSLIETPEDSGIIFEGVGRREPEARLFPEVCEWAGRDFRVFNLKIAESTARERLSKRGRADDNQETLEKRLKNFYTDTLPALEYFRSIGKVIDIDGEPLPEVVFAEIQEKISNL